MHHMNVVVSKEGSKKGGQRKAKARFQKVEINTGITSGRVVDELIAFRKHGKLVGRKVVSSSDFVQGRQGQRSANIHRGLLYGHPQTQMKNEEENTMITFSKILAKYKAEGRLKKEG